MESFKNFTQIIDNYTVHLGRVSMKLILSGGLVFLQACSHAPTGFDGSNNLTAGPRIERCTVITNFNSNFIFGSKVQRNFTYQITAPEGESIDPCWSKIQEDREMWCQNLSYNASDVRVEITLQDQSRYHAHSAVASAFGHCNESEFKMDKDLVVSLSSTSSPPRGL